MITSCRVLGCDKLAVFESQKLCRMHADFWFPIGGAKAEAIVVPAPESPTSALPTSAADRKGIPVMTGFLDYFPAAVAEVAKVSKAGNDQHNPGQPMHWAREKSKDHADCAMRHLMDRGTFDTDGFRHSAKAAWRAMAN